MLSGVDGNSVEDESLPWASFEITDEAPELANALMQRLHDRGLAARVVEHASSEAEVLIVTAALARGTPQEVHWNSLVHIRTGHARGVRVLVVLQDSTTRREPDEFAGWSGGCRALTRTAAREWPDHALRSIDIALDATDPARDAERIVRAMNVDLPCISLHAASAVSAPQACEAELPVQGTTAPPPRVWLVTGGARGITADCVIALANRSDGVFALVGRSPRTPWPSGIEPTDDLSELRARLAQRLLAAGERPAPATIDRQAREALAGRQIDITLKALAEAGVTACYHSCDLSVPDQVRQTVAAVEREHGAVSALIHGAGTLADRLIVDKTRDELNRVFATKLSGLKNLLDTLHVPTLSHVALFSSAAAFFGNPGQADYAMANEVLNRVARSLASAAPATVVKSFNWGPWNGGMVDASLADHFASQGVPLIQAAAGAALFADELLWGPSARVEMLVGEPWVAGT